ncbi:MAG: phosphoribosylformylglycinamidine synthase subunit PurS [Deltaproteobacteria bacterium]|nr:phosphoribosylformylglycinamidine synthase subunit PurS [Deltaproteobacteria bacterium]
MKAKIYVTLKKGVHDPQGEAVLGTLKHLGFKDVKGVRVGKYIELNLDGVPADKARHRIDAMCAKLLANPVIESYSYELD